MKLMNSLKVVFAFCMLVLFSCQENGEDGILHPLSTRSTVFLNVQDTIPQMSKEMSDIKDIVIPQYSGEYDFYKIVESIKYVPLEKTTQSVLGYIDKVALDDSVIFVLDKDNSKALRYSMDGHFLGFIGSVGSEVGQYMSISDMSLDYKNKRVCILDSEGGNQIFYDYNGTYLSEQPLYYHYQQIEFSGDNQVLNMSFSENEEASQLDCHRLVVAQGNQIPLAVGFPYPEELRKNFHYAVSKSLQSNDGRVYYNHVLSDTIWEICGSVSKALYRIGLENKVNVLSRISQNSITDDMFVNSMSDESIGYKGLNLQTRDCLCLFITKHGIVEPVLYNKSTGHVLSGFAFASPRNNLFEMMCCNVFDESDGDYFIKVVQPFDIFRLYKDRKLSLSQDENLLLSRINEESNPVLVFVKLKKF